MPHRVHPPQYKCTWAVFCDKRISSIIITYSLAYKLPSIVSYINGIEERVDVPRIQPINTTTIGGGQKVLLSKFRQLKQIVAVGAVC